MRATQDYVSSVSSSYMRAAFNKSTDQLIQDFEEQTEAHGVQFDSVVALGVSGLMVMPIIGRHFGCHMLALRKENDGSHTEGPNAIAEGSIGERWILIDDIVFTGTTILTAQQKVRKFAAYYALPFSPKYMGTWTYSQNYYRSTTYYEPVDNIGSSMTRIYVDDEPHYVTSKKVAYIKNLWHTNSAAINPKTETIKYLREHKPDWDLDETIKILIWLENTV